jgi:Cu/Ag efflux pump CusA
VDVIDTTEPNTFNREHLQRRIVDFCNVQGRDLNSVVADICERIVAIEDRLRRLPGNYHIDFGGQFDAQRQATFRLLVLGSFSIIGIFLVLVKCLES